MLVAGGDLALISVRESSRSKMAFGLISNGGGEWKAWLEMKSGLMAGRGKAKGKMKSRK